ncbi:spermidine synthase [Salinimicrobium oceani]|uniref:Fused MFS/spermidine synthase n=1 Tax=Salinimicrobium oceani TaxID=2722702 RepID=A0ABX1CXT8_9FLAO|nr:fused MFS/spermidine synthase [Salinimicrobium oceani]NJW53073.1 fused MFS/spermidine synthase [Salinimicrobium oceani]
MKKQLSYLWPLTRKYNSRFNGQLEVTWSNGRKVLDSSNANYSYGPLQEVLDFGLSKVNANRASPILLLGLGGGSVIPLLRKKYRYYSKITAVELDPDILEIAKSEFQVEQYQPLELVCTDAEAYVASAKGKFGLIIVDLFLDLSVPPQFFSLEFWQQVEKLLEKHGKVLFNAGINNAHKEHIASLLENNILKINFERQEDVQRSNTLLLGSS